MIVRIDRNMLDCKLADVTWRKSRHSGTEDACVETAFLADGDVAVRDSKNRSGPVLRYTPGEWRAFIAGVKDGEFELP
jgi:sirohydrochlorin ferrochelatase